MRLLVYPHDLQIGGSQINAIDLAAAAAQAGHQVFVYGIPGPLVSYIKEKGLPFLPAHGLKYRPAPTRIRELAGIARRLKIDLIHAYEWPPCLDAYCGAGMLLGTPILCTVLSMSVMPYVPASTPLIMGTLDLADEARRVQRGQVWTLEPPIDVVQDHPGIDGRAFRHALGAENQFLAVTVSRLAVDLKLDALVRAIDAVDTLAASHPIRLAIVGGGHAQPALQQRAQAVNQRRGREVVTLCGPSLDPRPAYAAADLVLGMGSSALRAMAIGRAVVVQGENGFSEIFEPSTYELFLRQGFYGTRMREGTSLSRQIESLVQDPARRLTLGRYGRDVVVQRFSLERAKQVQFDIYDEVLGTRSRNSMGDGLRAMGRALWLEVLNHDPRQKKQHHLREHELLRAAGSGTWPVPLSVPAGR